MLDGVGYSGGESGTVDAFDTADGTERWQAQLGGVVRNVAIADGVLYALSDGPNAIYALDASTGEQLWEFVLDSGIDGGIAVHGGAAYVAHSLRRHLRHRRHRPRRRSGVVTCYVGKRR